MDARMYAGFTSRGLAMPTFDLRPDFGTSRNMISSKERERWQVEEQVHGNAYNWKQDEERRILAREAEDVSRRKLYDGKAKYGGMNVSQALEAKGLRDENTRWRKLWADLSLDKGVLQSVTENRWSPSY